MSSFTRKAIMESCIRLLEDRPVDKITVKDIVEDCQINRNTFYYHFKDKYDVINWIFYTEITPLIIMSKLQEFDYESATAIALVTLAVSFLILFGVNLVQARNTKRIRGRDA